MNNSIRAFAVGILFATGVTGCAYAFEGSKQVVLEEDEIRAYAEDNSLVVLTKEEYDELLPKLEVETEVKEEVTEPEKEEKVEEPKEVKEEVKEEEKVEEPKTFTLTIKEGMGTHDATKELEKAGIIDNAFQFGQYLEKNDKSRLVQLGTFELKEGMSFEEITKVITKGR